MSIVSYTKAKIDTLLGLKQDAATLDAATAALVADAASSTAVAQRAAFVPKGTLVFNVKDYGAVGNGTTNDTAAFAAAIAAAVAAGGGIVYIPASTYRALISLPSNVTLRGAGAGATVIKRPAGSGTAHVIQFADVLTEKTVIEHLEIDGDSGSGSAGHGIYCNNTGGPGTPYPSGRLNPQHVFRDVYIHHTNGDGLHLEGTGFAGGNRYEGIYTYYCNGYGIYAGTPDNVFANCDAGQSGLTGFMEGGNGGFNRYAYCKSWLSGRVSVSSEGYGFRANSRSQYIGCTAQDNRNDGFSLFNRQTITLTGCVADTNTGAGFNLNGASSCLVQGEAFDRGGDSGTDPAKQQFGASVDSGTIKNTIILTAGAHGTAPIPSSVFNTDNVVIGAIIGGAVKATYGPITVDGSTGVVTSKRPSDFTSGDSTLSRREVSSTSVSLQGAGTVLLTYFTATKTETVTQMRFISGGTAAVGATLVKFGLFSVDASGNLTLVASTPSDTTLLTSTFTRYTKSFSASVTKTAGQRYAAGIIVVGASTMPTLQGRQSFDGAELFLAPTLAARVTGQTDLPASIAVGSLINASGSEAYAAILP